MTYVARVQAHNSPGPRGTIASALTPSSGVASFPWGGKEYTYPEYEVLTCDNQDFLFWEDSKDGEVPKLALKLITGRYNWEKLYIGRTSGPLDEGKTARGKRLSPPKGFMGPLLGKVAPDHECLYVAYEGSEYMFSTYHVLCVYQLPSLHHHCKPDAIWHKASSGLIPAGTLCGGSTPDGEAIYVGRARHGTQHLVPGQLVASEGCVRLAWGTLEHRCEDYEALVVDDQEAFEWVWASAGLVPSNAIPGGYQDGYDVVYIGRTVTNSNISLGRTHRGNPIPIREASPNTQLLGKIHCSHHCLYVPHSGCEYIYREYEVLVGKYRPQSLQHLCRNAILVSTNGVPTRIDHLPLPRTLREFCKLTKKEMEDMQSA